MATTANNETDGVQIKVWVSGVLYDLLKVQAGRRNSSVAGEARRLMQLGIATDGATKREQVHLETLIFRTALNAQLVAEVERERVLKNVTARLQRDGGDPSQAEHLVAEEWERLRYRATKALSHALKQNNDREGKVDEIDNKDKPEDENDDSF